MTSERRVLFWMCALVITNQLGFGAIIPVLPLYAQSFGVPASAIGMAIAIYGLARFASALPSAVIADRFGRRPALAIGGVITALGNLWCAIATGYIEFLSARFLAGFGAGLLLAAGQVVLADISPPERRGRNIALYQSAFIFAVGAGPYPGGLLAEHYGLAAPFLAYGLAGFIVTLIAWFAVGETRDLTPRGERRQATSIPLSAQVRQLARHRGYVLVSLISMMNAVARTGGLFVIVPMLMSAMLGLSAGPIGLALTIGSLAGLIAAYPGGWLTDRYGRKAVIVPSTIICAVSMAMFALATSYAWFVAACIVWSISSSISISAPAAYAADVAPPGMNAAAMSTYRMTADAGYVIGPLLLGLIADLFGPIEALMFGAVAMLVVGAAFAVGAPETLPKTHP